SAITTGRVEIIDGVQVEVNVAYWAADEIAIGPHTRVVLDSAQSYLTIITRKLSVGDDVVFTWQRPVPAIIPKFTGVTDPQRRKPPKPPQSNATSRDDPEAGAPGYPAFPGETGASGA